MVQEFVRLGSIITYNTNVTTTLTIIAYTSQPITRFFTLASWASVHVMSLEGCVYKTRSELFFSVWPHTLRGWPFVCI